MKHHYLNRNRQKEKLDEDGWTNAKSASLLISYLCQCADQAIVDFVFDLIKDYIGNDDSKIRESVILAFGSILETIYAGRIKEIIEGAIPTLLNLLSDKNIDVRTSVSWCLRKICKYHSDCLMNMKVNNPNLLNTFIGKLINSLDSNKRVIMQILDCFNNLCENTNVLKNSNISKTCILSCYYETILNKLLEIAFKNESYNKENNVSLGAFYTINNFINFAPLDTKDIIQTFFLHIVNALQSTDIKENYPDNEKRYLFQEYLCSIISSYLNEDKINLTIEQAEYLYNLIKGYFISRENVFEFGISSCSKLVIILSNANIDKLNDFVGYIDYALNRWFDEVNCKMALSGISDLIRNLENKFNRYMDRICLKLFEITEVFYLIF